MLRSLISGKPVYGSAQVIPEPGCTVCITGHREKSIAPYQGDLRFSELTKKTVRLMLCRYIAMAAEAGYTRFLSGLATGTDLWAADYILKLRTKDERIKLIGVMPYLRHAERFPADYRMLLENAENGADCLLTTCTEPQIVYGKRRTRYTSPDLYRDRNYYMVDNSAAVIAFFEPSETMSGTAQTVNRAVRSGKLIRSFGLREVYSLIDSAGPDLRRIASALSFMENVFASP